MIAPLLILLPRSEPTTVWWRMLGDALMLVALSCLLMPTTSQAKPTCGNVGLTTHPASTQPLYPGRNTGPSTTTKLGEFSVNMNFSHCVFTDTTVERLETRDGYTGFNDLNRVSLNGNVFQADYGMTCQNCVNQPAENIKFTVTRVVTGQGSLCQTSHSLGNAPLPRTMVSRFSQECTGFDVLMTDISEDSLAKALSQIDRNIERQVSRGKVSAEAKAAAMARIRTTLRLADVGPCDLIIEAATERETVKQAIFEDLLPHLKPHTILTSNTSSISITRLASRTDRPEKFMGFHFMNPVPVMQLVELIRGIATDAPTYQSLLRVVEKLGKTAASAEDFPAFIVNRILMPMINEAVYTLYEGVGSVKSIDESLKLGANHPMGPLELADFIGLDTCLAIMNVLHDGLADTKYRPCPLLTKYVEAGWLGRKTQRGFYDYRGEVPVPTR